jgi:DNA-binding response OmpR family regulator
MKDRILVIEDDTSLATLLRENLDFEGFEVQVVADGGHAVSAARSFLPHLIILDIMLPSINGFELCTILRRNGRTPILMTSARSAKNDKVKGLNLGADDYLAKPFELEELLARVSAILRRSRPATEVLLLGTISIDFRTHTARRGSQDVHLTHREFDLLRYLSERQGQIVSREELLRDLWEFPDSGITRSVDHAIGRLRRKVETDPHRPRFIHTAVGHGYVLTPTAGASSTELLPAGLDEALRPDRQ